jgi:hypothetical protein
MEGDDDDDAIDDDESIPIDVCRGISSISSSESCCCLIIYQYRSQIQNQYFLFFHLGY